MKAAKTANLLMDAFNYEQRIDRRIATTKPSIDDRDGQQIATRAGLSPRDIDFAITPEMNVFERMIKLGGPAVSRLFVDEAQFLTPEQIDQLNRVALEMDIPVDTYGLRSDFMTHLFPGSKRLFEVATKLRELEVPCNCESGAKAIFNIRYVGGKFVASGDQVAIEKDDVTYDSICAQCYHRLAGSEAV
jgi:thymidine kinase